MAFYLETVIQVLTTTTSASQKGMGLIT